MTSVALLETRPIAVPELLPGDLNILSGFGDLFRRKSLESRLSVGARAFSKLANVTTYLAGFKANRAPSYDNSPLAMAHNSAVEDYADKVPEEGYATAWLVSDRPGTPDKEIRAAFHYLPGAEECDSTRRLGDKPTVRFWGRTGDDQDFQPLGSVFWQPFSDSEINASSAVSLSSTDDFGRPYLKVGSGKTARTIELKFDSNGNAINEFDDDTYTLVDSFRHFVTSVDSFRHFVASFEAKQRQQRKYDRQQQENDIGSLLVQHQATIIPLWAS
jgi:hypothetical protein